jgi:hypothetical protein
MSRREGGIMRSRTIHSRLETRIALVLCPTLIVAG